MPIGTVNFTHIDCYALSTVLVYNILGDLKARNSEGLIPTVESIIVKPSKVRVLYKVVEYHVTAKSSNVTVSYEVYLVMHYLKGNKGAKMYIGNKRHIDILHQNLPGVTMSKEQIQYNLEIILTKRQPDILILSEVGPSIIDGMNFENYELVVGNITLEVKECRVSALISQNLRYNKIEILSQVPVIALEVLGFTIIGLYREWQNLQADPKNPTKSIPMPYNNPVKRFKSLTQELSKIKGKVVILGDFNFCALDMGEIETQRKYDPLRKIWEDDMASKGFIQLVKDKTRFQRGDRATCLDHIWTNDTNNIIQIYNKRVVVTDHHLIGLKLNLIKQRVPDKVGYIRKLDAINEDDFYFCWESFNPIEILYETRPEEKVKLFTEKLTKTLEILAPEKKTQLRVNYKPWWNCVLESMNEYREWLDDVQKQSGKKEDKLKHNQQCRKFRSAVSYVRKKYLIQYYDCLKNEDNGQAKCWKRVMTDSKLKVKTDKQITLVDQEQGTIYNTDKACADLLNTHFKTKVKKLEATTEPSTDLCREYAKEYLREIVFKGRVQKKVKDFNFKQVSTTDILEIIKGLNNTKAVGHDKIPIQILKRFKYFLAVYIRDIVNTCIATSVFPTDWKLGIIRPLPKKGNLQSPNNWRPIVLNCNLSKILEKVLNAQLKNFLETSSILSSTQHAYRKNKSCLSAWVELDTRIQDARNRKKVCALLCTDQSAAFNLVKSDIILAKLETFGVGKSSRNMIGNYLTGRKTKTKIRGYVSPEIELESGVGEGSVVGPLFFISVLADVEVVALRATKIMNDTGKVVEIYICSYADDVSAVVVADDEDALEESVNVLLEEFRKYFSSCGLAMNPTKSELIVFRNRGLHNKIHKLRDLYVCGQKESEKVKLLGITVNNQYDFKDHAKNVVTKLKYKSACLKRIAELVPGDILRMIGDSILRGTITYGLEVYGRDKSLMKTIQVAYNIGIRVVTKSGPVESIAPLLVKLKWLNVKCMYKMLNVQMMYRLFRTSFSQVAHGILVRGQMKVEPSAQTLVNRVRVLKIDWKPRIRPGLDAWINCATEIFNRLDAFKFLPLVNERNGKNKALYEETVEKLKCKVIEEYGNGNHTHF